jgi:hypothetical protein
MPITVAALYKERTLFNLSRILVVMEHGCRLLLCFVCVCAVQYRTKPYDGPVPIQGDLPTLYTSNIHTSVS